MKFSSSARKKNDNKAREFEILVRPHVPALYQVAYKLAGCRIDAEDIVQDVLVKLFARTGELQQIRDLRPWLTKVVYHQFIDHCRQQQRSPVSMANRHETERGDLIEAMKSPFPGPEQEVGAQRQSERVLDALNSLDQDARTLVVLHLMEGFTLEELTGVFNVPLGTLKSRLHRVKSRMKRHLSLEPLPALERGKVGSY